jgi:hypothetical protein
MTDLRCEPVGTAAVYRGVRPENDLSIEVVDRRMATAMVMTTMTMMRSKQRK